jgi:hypothetical protein
MANELYCAQCTIVYEIARNPDKMVGVVLPPHDPNCPKLEVEKPQPLLRQW